ncbi:MAG TPA: hypothetical protein VFX48_08210 [Saprospiraceae bacterium]|nr:hypothetical protein [Saprospiraceae bacterium]
MYLRRHLVWIGVCSLVGMSATFMPWLVFPKSGSVLYGYVGDGVVTGFVFLILSCMAAYAYFKNAMGKLGFGMMGLMASWMAYLSYSKHRSVEYDKVHFTTDNPIYASAIAGVHQGIGIYVIGIAGIGILLGILSAVITQSWFPADVVLQNASAPIRISTRYIIPLLLLAASISGYYYYSNQADTTVNLEVIRPTLTADLARMGVALVEGDYDRFADFNHLIMVQSMGGRERLIDLVRATVEGMKKDGTSIEGISLAELHDVARKGRNIQAVITQKVRMVGPAGEKIDLQKMLAVSDDLGESWHFMNITGKTKMQMQTFFPDLNPNLEF